MSLDFVKSLTGDNPQVEVIYNNILEYEEKDEDGLNGFILLIHIGTDPKRTDKLYDRLDDLIVELKKRGYEFVRIDDLLI